MYEIRALSRVTSDQLRAETEPTTGGCISLKTVIDRLDIAYHKATEILGEDRVRDLLAAEGFDSDGR